MVWRPKRSWKEAYEQAQADGDLSGSEELFMREKMLEEQLAPKRANQRKRAPAKAVAAPKMSLLRGGSGAYGTVGYLMSALKSLKDFKVLVLMYKALKSALSKRKRRAKRSAKRKNQRKGGGSNKRARR